MLTPTCSPTQCKSLHISSITPGHLVALSGSSLRMVPLRKNSLVPGVELEHYHPSCMAGCHLEKSRLFESISTSKKNVGLGHVVWYLQAEAA